MKVLKRIEKWKDYDSVETIFKLICNTEVEMGEDFIDQNENIVMGIPFVFYLLGKGLITSGKANIMIENDVSLQEMMYEFEVDYSLFPYGECDPEAHDKWIYLLSDLIFQFNEYKKRLFNVLSKIPYTNCDDELISMTLDEADYETSENGLELNNLNSWWKCGTIHDRFINARDSSIEDIQYRSKKRHEEEYGAD